MCELSIIRGTPGDWLQFRRMARLMRTVRFSIGERPPGAAGVAPDGENGFAGRPTMTGLGRYYEIDVTCRGEPDRETGYLINIKEIDRAVRERAIPIVIGACRTTPWVEPASLLSEMLAAIGDGLPASIEALRWRLTPYHSVEMKSAAQDRIVLRQQFDFAAAHRLHVSSLSDARNREVFGRCNNPNAHGHNYRIEPAVEVSLQNGAPALTLLDVERLTAATIIDRFDHKNLSQDCPEFREPKGVNPSVENIARVLYQLLAPQIESAAGSGQARLKSMTVWETDRTCCVYEPG